MDFVEQRLMPLDCAVFFLLEQQQPLLEMSVLLQLHQPAEHYLLH